MPPAIQHPSRHVWDFWYHFDPQTRLFHLFYLNADRALVASQQHHYAACVGHATTADFVTIDWGDEESIDVLRPPVNHWANTCLWSGDVVAVKNGYLMAYTSRDGRQGDGLTQSIGMAYSRDLGSHRWQFFDTQIQPQAGYQTQGVAGDLTIHAWRDPYLFRHRPSRQIFMLASAKAVAGPPHQSGVVALLQIGDDQFAPAVRGQGDWAYLPPLVAPGCYGEMEVPQLYGRAVGGYELLFSCWSPYDFSPATGGAGGLQGIAISDFTPLEGHSSEPTPPAPRPRVLMAERQGLYACRVVPELGGEIVGFDIAQGGIRRSGQPTDLVALDRDFSDLVI
ncbi:MAG TPA: beta-fructosidase [Nodosilinea sp.]|nr:beta-fructosidase [Nodosilinea sp.]